MSRLKKRPDRVYSARITFACFPRQADTYRAAAETAQDGPLELSEWIRDALDLAAAKALRSAKPAPASPAPVTPTHTT